MHHVFVCMALLSCIKCTQSSAFYNYFSGGCRVNASSINRLTHLAPPRSRNLIRCGSVSLIIVGFVGAAGGLPAPLRNPPFVFSVISVIVAALLKSSLENYTFRVLLLPHRQMKQPLAGCFIFYFMNLFTNSASCCAGVFPSMLD